MKRIAAFLFAAAALLPLAASLSASASVHGMIYGRPFRLVAQRPRYRPGEWVVRFKSAADEAAAGPAICAALGAQLLSRTPQLDIETIRTNAVMDDDTVVAAYRDNPHVKYIERNLMRYPLTLADPNDPYYDEIDYTTPNDPSYATWYKWDAHLIQAVNGWNIWPGSYTKPAKPVTLAVIDTGIDYTHPDFVNAGGTGSDVASGGQLLRPLDRTMINGNTVQDAVDDYGHGTHVSGIAAAAVENGVGVTGNGWTANLIELKVLDSQGNGTESDIVRAIEYAADNGALIINMSIGGYTYSQAEQDAVNYAWSKGTLCIAAAGNDGDNLHPNYPAALSKVLAVAATGYDDSPATYSNYGDYIGISAPGGDFDINSGWFIDIYSTMPTYYVTLNDPNQVGATETYSYLEGTSMASPQVAGIAALYAGMMGFTQSTPGMPLILFQALQQSADNVSGVGGWTPYWGFGRVNVYGQMNLPQNPNPRGDTVGCILGGVSYHGTRIQNASLVAVPRVGTVNQTATSKSDGSYLIADAPSGVYDITATVFSVSQTLTGVVVVNGAGTPGTDFDIQGGNPTPSLSSISPKTIYASGADTTITVHGANFVSGSLVQWNGASLSTTFVSPITLTAVVPGSDLTTVGSKNTVAVFSPAPGGGPSNAITVKLAAPGVASVRLSPTTATGGKFVQGTVTLTNAAPSGGETVALASSVTAAASVPATVTVPAGVISGSFVVTTYPVTASTAVLISATYGSSTKSKLLTVNPPVLQSVKFSATTITGGSTALGTVALSGPAPTGGVKVTFASSDTAHMPAPASVTVAAGAKFAQFKAPTTTVAANTLVTLTATLNGLSKQASITITP